MLYFDIGAYVGDKSVEYLSLGAKVIAVEPNPDSYATLSARFTNNPQVITVNKAVSDHIGTAELTVPTCNLATLSTLNPETWYTGRWAGLKAAKTHTVQVTTLDKLIDEYGLPDFAKIDAEGHEESILRGLSQPVNLSLEFQRGHWDSLARCLRLLRKLGPYRCRTDGTEWLTPSKMLHELRLHGDWGDLVVEYNI